MFESLGRLVFRRRRLVLAAAGVLVVVAALWGTGVFGSLSGGGFQDPDSDSARAAQQATRAFGRHQADVVVLYASPTLTVDDAAFRAAVQRTLAALPHRYVAKVTSWWDSRAPQLVSADRHATYAVLELAGADGDARQDALAAIRGQLAAPGLSTKLGGQVAIDHDIDTQVARDIARAESLSMPLLLVGLVVVFGALAAAGMPLVVGGLAILGAFTALRLITMVTDVSVFAINLVTMLGLGLAIDYALLIVSRFREELASRPAGAGRRGVEDALVRTMASAGRTVCFSGITVAIALAGLLWFPQMFLRSMGFGGIAAVLVAMVAALTVLPALLGVLGPRVNALSLPWRRRRQGSCPTDITALPAGTAPTPPTRAPRSAGRAEAPGASASRLNSCAVAVNAPSTVSAASRRGLGAAPDRQIPGTTQRPQERAGRSVLMRAAVETADGRRQWRCHEQNAKDDRSPSVWALEQVGGPGLLDHRGMGRGDVCRQAQQRPEERRVRLAAEERRVHPGRRPGQEAHAERRVPGAGGVRALGRPGDRGRPRQGRRRRAAVRRRQGRHRQDPRPDPLQGRQRAPGGRARQGQLQRQRLAAAQPQGGADALDRPRQRRWPARVRDRAGRVLC